MRKHAISVASLALLCASSALAVDFGVMESADPVAKGDFKFEAYPLASRKTALREEDTGVNVAIGYGFWEHADAELQLSTYDDMMYVGSDIEYNLIDGDHHEFSLDFGAHYGNSDFGNQIGVDFTPLYSYKPASLPGFKWIAALDLAYDWVDIANPRNPRNLEDRYTSVYLVPGAQYRVAKDVDLIGEFGYGLNDASNSYLTAGVSFYFR